MPALRGEGTHSFAKTSFNADFLIAARPVKNNYSS
jgi:hypothetical protein